LGCRNGEDGGDEGGGEDDDGCEELHDCDCDFDLMGELRCDDEIERWERDEIVIIERI
jgi:hypothetical protein